MNLDQISGFYKGGIGTEFKFEKLFEYSFECVSFDIEQLPDQSYLLAAICNELDRDIVFLAKLVNNKVQEIGKMEIEHDFDYIEIHRPSSNTN